MDIDIFDGVYCGSLLLFLVFHKNISYVVSMKQKLVFQVKLYLSCDLIYMEKEKNIPGKSSATCKWRLISFIGTNSGIMFSYDRHGNKYMISLFTGLHA